MNLSRPATGIQWNKQAVGVACCLIAFLLYVFYTILPSMGPRYHDHSHKSWKNQPHQQIPQAVINLQGKVLVEEKEIEIMMGDNTKIKIFYREAQSVIKEAHTELPVILLHGAGDHSGKWEKLGTMHLIAAMGHRIVAVDLPGWGKTKGVIDISQEKLFLKPFLQNIKMERPVIIAASYGGNYAIPYLMEPEGDTCHRRSRGFVPIATTSTGRYKAAQYHRCSVPSMLVFGVNDTHLGLGMVGDLRNLLNNEIEPIEKAGHAVMFQQPEKFHSLIYNFITTLTLSIQ